MKNIVFSGAGPIGLFAAILFAKFIKENNLNVPITVIDSRIDSFDRPGIVAKKILDIISQYLKVSTGFVRRCDDADIAIFICDLQKELLKIARGYGIKIVPADFKDFKEHAIVPTNGLTPIPCDFALDFTGAIRALLKKINEKYEKKPFEYKRIGDNPIKNHFVAYINMDEKNSGLMHVKPSNQHPLNHIQSKSVLRSKFGWTETSEPELTFIKYTLPDGGAKESRRVRYYCYFEISETVKENSYLQKEYLKELLKLKVGDEIEFDIEPGKLKFTHFPVDPHWVPQSHHFSSETGILTVVGGDAQIQPDYRLGVGMLSGIRRAIALVDALSVNKTNGGIDLNIALYEQLLREPISWHLSELEKDYRLRREALTSYIPEREEKNCLALLAHIETNDSENLLAKELVRHELEFMQSRLAEKLYNDGLQVLKDKTSDSLLRAKELFIAALNKIPPTKSEEIKKIQLNLKDIANQIKQKANELFSRYQFIEANKYYLESLEIYTTYFKDQCMSEIIKIHSNIAIVSNKLNLHEDAIHQANQALKWIPEAKLEDKERMIAKINMTKCTAIIKIIKSEITKENINQEKAKALFVEAKHLLNELTSGPLAKDSTIQTIAHDLTLIEDKINNMNSITPNPSNKI